MIKARRFALGILLASGVAVAACGATIPMVGFVLNVGFLDVIIAGLQGYSNAPRAAAMKELDKMGEQAYGKEFWRANSFQGPVTYKTGSGSNIVTETKPCNQKAVDSVPRPEDSVGQSYSGSGGGYIWYGGRVYSGGECIYGCRTGAVTVGEIEEA